MYFSSYLRNTTIKHVFASNLNYYHWVYWFIYVTAFGYVINPNKQPTYRICVEGKYIYSAQNCATDYAQYFKFIKLDKTDEFMIKNLHFNCCIEDRNILAAKQHSRRFTGPCCERFYCVEPCERYNKRFRWQARLPMPSRIIGW